MAASYPGSVRNFLARVDLVDTVIADNVNSLQEELKAVQTTLGSAATGTSPLASAYSGTFTTTTTWTTLSDRITNIESGLVNGVGSYGNYTINVSRLSGGTSGYALIGNGAGVAPTYQALPSAYVSQTNGTVTTASISSGVVRNVYVKTVAPAGADGAVGDIWIVYA
jgi:hypothetical protein